MMMQLIIVNMLHATNKKNGERGRQLYLPFSVLVIINAAIQRVSDMNTSIIPAGSARMRSHRDSPCAGRWHRRDLHTV